ncbi:MAG TPA: transcriptional activator NhaR [Gemmatimonadaceae bacterium]|nr:transcriptional activator NhaR [Gemmatimonadaceae bacterium]
MSSPSGTSALNWLNYHHLLYFWTVARTGSITRACLELHLTQPAVSAQLRTLERRMGHRLFMKSGRGLALTETGQLVYRYADDIFRTGRELQETLAGRPSGQPMRFQVGIADAMPKLLAFKLLEPALGLPDGVRLILRENKADQLLSDLAMHAVDLVLSDAPASPSIRVRAYSHLLGECGVTVFAHPDMAPSLRRRFPASLQGAPFLVPTDNTALRRSLEEWFTRQGIQPRIVAEIEDSAVLKVFGEGGLGLFVAPTAVETEVARQYRVKVVGRIAAIRERFYAISAERRLKNPAVVAIREAARAELFHQ